MKKKELKNLAQKIAKYEKIISNSMDEDEVKLAKNQSMYLTAQVEELEDFLALDEEIMKILSKKD